MAPFNENRAPMRTARSRRAETEPQRRDPGKYSPQVRRSPRPRNWRPHNCFDLSEAPAAHERLGDISMLEQGVADVREAGFPEPGWARIYRSCVAGIIGAGRSWTAWTISVLSIPAQVNRGDREVGVAQLALDDEQRHPLARHLDRVRVSQLVRREASSNTRPASRMVEL
jgi:hypothetical protein